MRICTFNIQNNYRSYDNSKTKDIYKFLKDNKIDILGLQEVFGKCSDDLDLLLKSNYHMEGNYRFISKYLLRRFNEKTPIITKYNIVGFKTFNLPFFPSLLKRVITHVVINYKGEEISIYNTHLEVKNENVKRRQLNKIYRLLINDPRRKILMGDFNLKNNNPLFLNFINSLEKIGIKRIPLNEKTLKNSKYSREIDHIFLSDEFRLKEKRVVKDLEISDHYPVVVEIEL